MSGNIWLRAALTALQFETRLRVPQRWVTDGKPLTAADFGRSTRFFPLVGLVLGLSALVLVGLFAVFFAQTYFLAVLCVLLPVALTGGLHWDGFIDTMDGLCSWRDRERMLEIMRDSRVGSYGLLAVVSLLLLQGSMFLSLPRAGIILALLLMPLLGRWGMVLAIAAFPYARNEGMGKAFADSADRTTVCVATLTAAAVALPWGVPGLLALLVSGGVALLAGRHCTQLLGGLTGDTYGCIELLTETTVLFTLLAWAQQAGMDSIPWK